MPDAPPPTPTGRTWQPAQLHRRAVPPRLSEDARQRLRWLLDDPEHWVLRTNWEHYLATGDSSLLVPTDSLTQDQRVAASAWLQQQRHALHRALEGGGRAPDGWVENLPMMRAFRAHRDPTGELTKVPRQPAGPIPAIGERAG